MRGIIDLNGSYINQSAVIGGVKESEGPLAAYFDMFEHDSYFGQKTFEQGESEMVKQTLALLLSKSNQKSEDIDIISGGDLINQCTSTSFGISKSGIPFAGLYGACSTIVESLLFSAIAVSSGKMQKAVSIVSSHFCTAERQYRFPLEYGNQKTPTSQNTVTGCGAFLISSCPSEYKIIDGMFGSIVDMGVTDANNMGAAMAGAAVQTISRYFKESDCKPEDFDVIVTGDLGREGYEIACELFKKQGLDLKGKYTDCGMLIYDIEKQDMHSGGSGCACLATVLGGYFMQKMKKKEVKRILAVSTGALLNTKSVMQKLTIPGIAHAIHISGV